MMEDTLRPTVYCDIGHPEIQDLAAGLRRGEDDPGGVAARTFYFVRDRIRFGFDLYQRRASQTLYQGYGACWNKSLLLAALLRCNHIPARFGYVPVRRTFIKPAIGILHRMANHPYHHCLVRALINERWTLLDAVLDKGTYTTFYKPYGVTWDIDWNGKDDVHLYTESVVGPPVMADDIDKMIDERAGNMQMPRYLAMLANHYVNGRLWRLTGKVPCGRKEHALP